MFVLLKHKVCAKMRVRFCLTASTEFQAPPAALWVKKSRSAKSCNVPTDSRKFPTDDIVRVLRILILPPNSSKWEFLAQNFVFLDESSPTRKSFPTDWNFGKVGGGQLPFPLPHWHYTDRLCGATSTWHSVVSRTVAGDVVQAAPGTDGSTSFVGTTTPRLLTFGDEPRHVDIRGWRYGPRRLRVNDDDDWHYAPGQFLLLLHPAVVSSVSLRITARSQLGFVCFLAFFSNQRLPGVGLLQHHALITSM